jgi:beta-phosphoglucomutase-like phosphatase (HAD superfamily)
LENFFYIIISSEDIKKSKPDPEIFFLGAKKMRIDPSKCLVIEDSEKGVEAAKKAGMKCIGYKNKKSGNQDLTKADLITTDFEKLNIQKIIC